jgi:hypothetical protein
MLQEVVEGIVDRPCVEVCLGQAVEVGEDLGAAGVEVVVELATAAELEEVKTDSPPGEEACGIGNGVGDAAVRELVEPAVEVGEEVANRLDEGLPGDQGRPALRRWWRT